MKAAALLLGVATTLGSALVACSSTYDGKSLTAASADSGPGGTPSVSGDAGADAASDSDASAAAACPVAFTDDFAANNILAAWENRTSPSKGAFAAEIAGGVLAATGDLSDPTASGFNYLLRTEQGDASALELRFSIDMGPKPTMFAEFGCALQLHEASPAEVVSIGFNVDQTGAVGADLFRSGPAGLVSRAAVDGWTGPTTKDVIIRVERDGAGGATGQVSFGTAVRPIPTFALGALASVGVACGITFGSGGPGRIDFTVDDVRLRRCTR